MNISFRTALLSFMLVVYCHGGGGRGGGSDRRLTFMSGIFGFGTDQTNANSKDNNKNSRQDGTDPSGSSPHPPASMGFGRSASASILDLKEAQQQPQEQQPQQQQKKPPPPPPPRPPPRGTDTTTAATTTATSKPYQQDTTESYQQMNPPHPPSLSSSSQWTMGPPPQQQRQEQRGWRNQPPPPPQHYDPGTTSTSYDNNYYAVDTEYLHSELQEYLAREADLMAQLENLTSTLLNMGQREERHMRQLDVLTERVMDVEANAAEDRNLAAILEANCTALHESLSELQEELTDWQQRCHELAERHAADQASLEDLKKKIKEKEGEAEDLATAMENLRSAERRKGTSQSHRKGLFSWMLSFVLPRKEDYTEAMREEAFEMAKSTLLRALQVERANVHELESAVLSLQQNNSAISEMVESRDSIIDELNNRIAVFEEDKVVLKAALRQLQKEIKEEAPKAHKLMEDLSKAEKEIKRLQSDINGVIQTHQEEILALQKVISSKQQAISETESNLTAIGTYVDRLEERLTSFAVTRRDMELREQKCKDIEELAIVKEKECVALQEKVDEMTKSEEEIKKVLEELATERMTLQKDNRKLYTEREFRMAEQEQLQMKCAAFENATKTLENELQDWKLKSGGVVAELDAARLTNRELESKLERMAELEQELESTKERCSLVESNLQQSEDALNVERAETVRLGELANNQTTMLQDLQAKTEALERQQQEQQQKQQEEQQKQQEQQQKNKQPPPPAVPIKKEEPRNVPLRIFRKQVAKATGIHGFLTPPSQKEINKRRLPPRPVFVDRRSDQTKLGPPPPPSLPKGIPPELSQEIPPELPKGISPEVPQEIPQEVSQESSPELPQEVI